MFMVNELRHHKPSEPSNHASVLSNHAAHELRLPKFFELLQKIHLNAKQPPQVVGGFFCLFPVSSGICVQLGQNGQTYSFSETELMFF